MLKEKRARCARMMEQGRSRAIPGRDRGEQVPFFINPALFLSCRVLYNFATQRTMRAELPLRFQT